MLTWKTYVNQIHCHAAVLAYPSLAVAAQFAIRGDWRGVVITAVVNAISLVAFTAPVHDVFCACGERFGVLAFAASLLAALGVAAAGLVVYCCLPPTPYFPEGLPMLVRFLMED